LEWAFLIAMCARFVSYLKDVLSDRRIASIFLRPDPLLGMLPLSTVLRQSRNHGPTLSVDLTLPPSV